MDFRILSISGTRNLEGKGLEAEMYLTVSVNNERTVQLERSEPGETSSKR